MRESIKIVNAALDEIEGGTIVLRGVIAPDSLGHLKVDDYQREAQPLTSLKSLVDAMSKGVRVPDIEVGMRGEKYTEREGCFYLHDPVYIVDGLQRTTAAIYAMSEGNISPHVGCTLHFNTTKAWERDRFQVLNANRSKVSPNVLLRNLRELNPSIDMLYNLCQDSSFVLARKVAWGQRMNRGELITARSLLTTIARLHGHFGFGVKHSNPQFMAASIDKLMAEIGRTTLRDNVKTFFEVIDGAWGIRRIAYRDMAVYIKGPFLASLSQIISDHENFWQGNDEKRLFVAMPHMRKIGQFAIDDPTIQSLVSSGSGSNRNGVLYELMLKHINSGKRTGRLRPRNSAIGATAFDDIEDDVAA